jgi:hypothetical protein
MEQTSASRMNYNLAQNPALNIRDLVLGQIQNKFNFNDVSTSDAQKINSNVFGQYVNQSKDFADTGEKIINLSRKEDKRENAVIPDDASIFSRDNLIKNVGSIANISDTVLRSNYSGYASNNTTNQNYNRNNPSNLNNFTGYTTNRVDTVNLNKNNVDAVKLSDINFTQDRNNLVANQSVYSRSNQSVPGVNNISSNFLSMKDTFRNINGTTNNDIPSMMDSVASMIPASKNAFETITNNYRSNVSEQTTLQNNYRTNVSEQTTLQNNYRTNVSGQNIERNNSNVNPSITNLNSNYKNSSVTPQNVNTEVKNYIPDASKLSSDFISSDILNKNIDSSNPNSPKLNASEPNYESNSILDKNVNNNSQSNYIPDASKLSLGRLSSITMSGVENSQTTSASEVNKINPNDVSNVSTSEIQKNQNTYVPDASKLSSGYSEKDIEQNNIQPNQNKNVISDTVNLVDMKNIMQQSFSSNKNNNFNNVIDSALNMSTTMSNMMINNNDGNNIQNVFSSLIQNSFQSTNNDFVEKLSQEFSNMVQDNPNISYERKNDFIENANNFVPSLRTNANTLQEASKPPKSRKKPRVMRQNSNKTQQQSDTKMFKPTDSWDINKVPDPNPVLGSLASQLFI